MDWRSSVILTANILPLVPVRADGLEIVKEKERESVCVCVCVCVCERERERERGKEGIEREKCERKDNETVITIKHSVKRERERLIERTILSMQIYVK